MRAFPLLSLIVSLGLAPALQADVLVVGPGSLGGTHATVQSAVDAAFDGDVILVAVDSPGFTIDGKGLSVVAWPERDIDIQGTVRVTHLPAGSTVLLDQLSVVGASGFPQADTALELSSNEGQVRVQSCSLIGGLGTGYLGCVYGSGGEGVVIDTSMGVVLTDCFVLGGSAGNAGPACTGTRGGHGVVISTSIVALYDSEVFGGHGGHASENPGDGGHGVNVLSWGVFASGTEFTGGHCGYNPSGFGNGDGGDGLHLAAATQARLHDSHAFGGTIAGTTGNGSQGLPIGGAGSTMTLPGNHQSLEVDSLASNGHSFDVDLSAEPESDVWVFVSSKASLRFVAGWSGLLVVPANTAVTKAPMAKVPWSGHLLLELPSPLPADEAGTFWVQVLVRPPGGTATLSDPAAVVALRPDQLDPDCNLNGAFDLSDLLTGVSDDCDGSGVPDECEPPPTTWHVDPAAAAGGNGSLGAPFQTIQQAFDAASSCDTVLLADGIYTGPENRKLQAIGIYDLTVRSANGAASCVIDLQSQGHFWKLGGQHIRLEGVTVLHSSTSALDVQGGGSIEIVDCVFEACSGGSAGAIYVKGFTNSVRIEGCRFTGNTGLSAGAIFCYGIRDFSVVDSVFEGNTGEHGGAFQGQNVAVYPGVPSPHGDAVFARCTFLDNSAEWFGGAIYSYGTYLRLESCLLAGNSALKGGALATNNRVELDLCTFVDNSASGQGGAISAYGPTSGVTGSLLSNSILWGNTSPAGASIHLEGFLFGGAQLDVRSSNVQGGEAGVDTTSGGTLLWGAGNLDLEPLFADADGPDDDPLTLGDNDWRLAAGSPCIDAGSDALLPQDLADQDADSKRSERTPFDLDGAAREQDDPTAPDTGVGSAPIVDMGAYERP